MYRKIVVALSLEHGFADLALKTAASLADSDGEIQAVHAYTPLQESVRAYVSEDDLAKSHWTAESMLRERVAKYPKVKPVLIDGSPGSALVKYAGRIGADCIIVGSHKPGLSDYFLGSTAARVVRHAPCSVHVLR
jgi:nucleotide-binding universal stress UspA family protein